MTIDPQSPELDLSKIDYRNSDVITVDGLGGIQVRNGVAKLNFFSVRHAGNQMDEPVAAVVLSMSLGDLVGMATGLTMAVEQLQSAGFLSVLNVKPKEPSE